MGVTVYLGGKVREQAVTDFAERREEGGEILAEGSRNTDDIVIADLDLDLIREVRNTWQFYRDRRPETYAAITAP